MDIVIGSYPFVPFDELNYCHEVGIMYQRDMTASVEYDKKYFETYVRLEKTDIAKKLNAGRTSITEKYCSKILDIGIGSGEFIKESGILVYGYDINPVAIRWLREAGLYKDPYAEMPDVDGLSFWDTMEHIPSPSTLLSKFRPGMYAFIALPIFADLTKVKRNKHYKPNEHYYYYTTHGMVRFMNDSGFSIIEMSDQESSAGREDILTFVFRKN